MNSTFRNRSAWIATKTPNTVTVDPLVQRPARDRSKAYSSTEVSKEENHVELGEETALSWALPAVESSHEADTRAQKKRNTINPYNM